MKITITGFPGSGKSTLGKGIAKALDLKHYSAGDFLREIAKEKGLTLMQLQEEMKNDSSVDDELDRRNKELGETQDNFVVDGRMAWHFIPDSIKIFVKINLDIAAERVFKDIKECRGERHQELENKSVEETRKNMEKRMNMNKERYNKLYRLNYLDEGNYDIVVDTGNSGISETRERVLKQIKQYLNKE